ncbi:MAG: hypothetical protein RBS34_14280 [Desulfofustis sp.]|nr:hypothetical protein [Desulfofustis sp.]
MLRIILALLLIAAPVSAANWSAVVGMYSAAGGGDGGGGGAATGNYYPDGDLSVGADWYDNDFETTDLYADIDDSVTSGSSGDGNLVRGYDSAGSNIYEFSVANITGSITTLRVHLRAYGDGTSVNFGVALSTDGTTWETAVNTGNLANYTLTWLYVDFSVSATDTSDLRVRFIDPNGSVAVDACYVEANP